MDIKFLITAFIISQFVDWVFQWQWQALNKSKWGRADDKRKSFAALMSHALVYSAITTIQCVHLLYVVCHSPFLLVRKLFKFTMYSQKDILKIRVISSQRYIKTLILRYHYCFYLHYITNY